MQRLQRHHEALPVSFLPQRLGKPRRASSWRRMHRSLFSGFGPLCYRGPDARCQNKAVSPAPPTSLRTDWSCRRKASGPSDWRSVVRYCPRQAKTAHLARQRWRWWTDSPSPKPGRPNRVGPRQRDLVAGSGTGLPRAKPGTGCGAVCGAGLNSAAPGLRVASHF